MAWTSNEILLLMNSENKTIEELSELLPNRTEKAIYVQCSRKNITIKRITRRDLKNLQKEFKSRVFKLVGEEYDVVSQYFHSAIKVKMRHNVCNRIYEIEPNSFLQGTGCALCSGKLKKNTEMISIEIDNITSHEYTVVGSYIDTHTKIDIRHNNCLSIFPMTPHNFLSGQRCPICCESKGERSVRDYLEKSNNIYESQYSIKDCRNKLPLPFDFAVFDTFHNLTYLIEYDGIQHFECVEAFGGDIGFQKTKFNDEIKTNYCLDNKIRLIRIPYWKFDDIEDILENELNLLSLKEVI